MIKIKHYKRQELINSRVHGLTMKELREFVTKNPQIKNNTKVLIERIEDKYFKINGWQTLLVKGEQYYNTEEFNKKMLQEIKDRKQGKGEYQKQLNPQDAIVELTNDLKEQFFPAWCISKDKDFVYIFNHY